MRSDEMGDHFGVRVGTKFKTKFFQPFVISLSICLDKIFIYIAEGLQDFVRAVIVQIKLLERAALEAIHARPGLKAVMWSPVEVVQPQEFLSLWIITLETDERIPITESIRQGQRFYEYFTLNRGDEHQLVALFGPASEGAYHLGESITIKDRERYYTGEILYVIPPGKIIPNRKSTSRGYHTIGGTAYRNDVAARYIIDCNDGFPHIVYQSQVVQ